ncbi:MAG: CotH kinase family protein [Gemmataceae bacterium]
MNVACFLLITLFGQVEAKSAKPSKVDPSVNFFASKDVLRISIEIEPKQIQLLKMADRSYVPCTVKVEGGQTYTKVGIHLKGAAGSYRGLEDRPALSLNFDKFNDGQKFYGLDKLHLNNSVQDGSYLNELICRELSRNSGLPTGRATHAMVKLNNRDLGLYVLLEGLDRAFLKRNFGSPDGNLYDGGFCQDIDQPKKLLTGKKDQKDEQAPLKTLVVACREPDIAKRLLLLEALVDIDAFWTFIALEQVTAHWDGYNRNRNNYRIYFDPSRGNKAVFILAGMDQMFGDPNFDLRSMSCILANALMQCPGMYWRYNDALRKVYNQAFLLTEMNKRIDEVVEKLKPYRDIKGGGEDMKRRLAERGKVLDRLIGEMPAGPPKFGPDKSVTLAGWKPALESGPSLLLQSSFEDKTCLHIRSSADSIGSWRKPVALDPGKYRVEVLAKAVNVKNRNEPNSGVGIRISGGERTKYISESTGWEKINFEFDVASPKEIVLVLEMRSLKGEAYFDTSSMKLFKIN